MTTDEETKIMQFSKHQLYVFYTTSSKFFIAVVLKCHKAGIETKVVSLSRVFSGPDHYGHIPEWDRSTYMHKKCDAYTVA